MPRLSKDKTYAIKYLLSIGKNIEDIAQELKVTEKQVSNLVEKEQKPEKSDPQKTKQNFMITHTSGKNTNCVSIMTQTASQVGDEFYKNQTNKTIDKSNHIFKPRP